MLDVCLLGTGGMMPLPYRWLTSLMTRYNGSSLMVDCSEGTQIAVKEKGWSFKPVDIMCFTLPCGPYQRTAWNSSYHGNAERTEPLTMIGPKGTGTCGKCTACDCTGTAFEIKFYRTDGTGRETIELKGYTVHAFRVNHNVTCYGYTLEIPRAGRFSVEHALERRYRRNTGAACKR